MGYDTHWGTLQRQILAVVIALGAVFSCETWGQTRDSNYPFAIHGVITLHTYHLAKCMADASKSDLNLNLLLPRESYLNTFAGSTSYCRYRGDNFFRYLSADSNRWCEYSTGKESELRIWVLEQHDNSIGIVEIYKQSLLINGGHVFDALLTIHQLLRTEARWWSPLYQYSSDNESAFRFWSKFVDIRGDLEERGDTFHGDHRGSWYRIWGIMLYRMTLQCDGQTYDTCTFENDGTLSNFLEDFATEFVGVGAELSKYILDIVETDFEYGGDRPGKSRMNTAGAKIANELIDAFRSGETLGPDSHWCSHPRLYMTPVGFRPEH